jgi:hexokinase
MNDVTRGNILDGELANGSKEHKLSDLVGKAIGLEIEKDVLLKLNQTISVAVCNDTVSLGLAGMDSLESQGNKSVAMAVGIVGTGYNFGFFDSSKTFINLESGNFSNFKSSSTLSDVDIKSSNPTRNLFEKEVAGAYLWQHFNLISVQHGLNTTVSDSVKLSDLAQNDSTQAGEIARGLFVRSANMVAAHIAALADFMLESDLKQKLNLFIEGSVFWKGFEFEKNVKLALKDLTDKEIEIREIEDSAILGAARLVG